MHTESDNTIQKIKISDFKINSLLEITLAINDNASTSRLLEMYENIISNELNIRRILVLFNNAVWESVISTGLPDDFNYSPEELVNRYLFDFSKYISVALSDDYPLNLFDVVIPVYHKETCLAYVLIGDLDQEKKGINPIITHLKFIQIITNIIVVAVENKRLAKENFERESLKKELEVASKMQEMLIPSSANLPKNEFVHISSLYKPYWRVSGDYYDVISLSKIEIGFCIADVSGKGISAAILMSNFQANFRAFFKNKLSLTDLTLELNKHVNANAQGEKYITFFVGKYNIKTKVLQYINAGHNPPLFYHNHTNHIDQLHKGCVGLGMLPEIPVITQGEILIESGDKLICYTDGLTEAENSKNISFGTEPIEKAIASSDSIEEAIELLHSQLEVFVETNFVKDDISILGFDFK